MTEERSAAHVHFDVTDRVRPVRRVHQGDNRHPRTLHANVVDPCLEPDLTTQLGDRYDAIAVCRAVHRRPVDAGVPCGPVNTIDKVFQDPQVKHLEVEHFVDHARLGRLGVVRQPVNLSDASQPETFRYPTPDLGEHNDAILAEMGLSGDEIAKLRDAGAI